MRESWEILTAMVELRGGSSNFDTAARLRRLVEALPTVLRRRRLSRTTRKRQIQRRLTPEQVEQLLTKYRAGASMQQLVRKWRLHRTTVASHLRLAGVPLRRQGIPPDRLLEAVRLYGEGWSCQRLGERYGCNAETVRQTLKSAGLTMRPRGNAASGRPVTV